MTRRSISTVIAPALVGLTVALTIGNWYLLPDRAGASVAALAVLAGMAAALAITPRLASRSADEAAGRRAVDTVSASVVFGALIMAIPLGAKAAVALGTLDRADRVTPVTMALVGAFLMFTGNSIPKMLTPLSALRCDPAQVQAFQRLTGWTWVLAGLGFAVSWLALPADIAQPVSVTLIAAAILVVLTQIVRLRWMRRKEA
jgi:hypothetical protein